MKKLRYALEGLVLRIFLYVFTLLGLDRASALGGWVGRTIGPKLAASRKARRNLETALPGRTEDEYDRIISGMWDNLGRVMAEYPHLAQIGKERVEIIHPEIGEKYKDAAPAIIFSAHIANWEIGSATMKYQYGCDVNMVYRPPNNPVSDKLLNNARLRGGVQNLIPKANAGREMVRCLSKGEHLGMLVDQKFNKGIPVALFARLAMTSPVYVQLAQKYDCPLIPARFERLEGAHFRVTFHEPVPHKDRAVEDVLRDAHGILEEWIIDTPEQWLWLHKRWDSKQLRET